MQFALQSGASTDMVLGDGLSPLAAAARYNAQENQKLKGVKQLLELRKASD